MPIDIPKLSYRKDIDGLRALAVIPVVLFHARVFGIDGGYVGVDIFFVISGYLITSILLKDLRNNNFSLWKFYDRRARRILPALLVMLLASTFFAVVFFTYPGDLTLFGTSLLSQGLFLANLFFLRNNDYFASPAETYPLLHTWSLSVEEQFYVFFPIILFLLYKFLSKRFFLILSVIGILSLLICIYFTQIDPLDEIGFLPKLWRNANNETFAFFFILTRAWELMIGALLAVTAFKFSSKHFSEISSVLGLFLIVYSIFFFDSNTLFPGYNALFPTVGAALIILGGTNNNPFVNRCLSIKPLVFVGLISYSLYLWHWPIFVFAKVLISDLNFFDYSFLVLLSFFAGWFSYVFVEKPFRHKNTTHSKYTVAVAVACLALVFVTGLMIKNGVIRNSIQGYEDIALLETEAGNELPTQCRDNLDSVECDLGNKNSDVYDFVLWGDSHAEMYYPVINEFAISRGLRGKYFALGGCEPISGVVSNPVNGQCEKLKAAALKFINENKIPNVIIAGRWELYAYGTSPTNNRKMVMLPTDTTKNFETASRAIQQELPATVKNLIDSGSNVFVFRQAPYQDFFDPRHIYYSSVASGHMVKIPEVTTQHHLEKQAFMDTVFSKLENMGAHIIDPTPILCADTNGNCVIVDSNGNLLYRNESHLNVRGTEKILPLIEDAIHFKVSS